MYQYDRKPPFPNSLRSVGDWAFYNSKFNGNLTLRNVRTIGAHAFEQVPFNDRGLTIPASVTEIGEASRRDNTRLTVGQRPTAANKQK